MADNGVWFKLWLVALTDPDLNDLSLEDFARWCRFGVFLKSHGNMGVIRLKEPCNTLQMWLRVDSFSAVISVLRRFPNCDVEVTQAATVTATVTMRNWRKYQVDSSALRTKRWRQRLRKLRDEDVTNAPSFSVTTKKRREEMRGEESKPPLPPTGFDRFWQAYPKKIGKGACERWWMQHKPTKELLEIMVGALSQARQTEQWSKDNGQFIPNPATWLNQKRWEDDITSAPGKTDRVRHLEESLGQ